MVIGISGKINSGKDTVGEIIRYLISYQINVRNWYYPDGFKPNIQYTESKWEIKKFAGKLKQIASLLTGIDVEKFEDQEFKKTLLGPEWGTVKHNPLNAIPVFGDIQFNEMMSVRELLQKLGTEAMREGLHPNIWVNSLFSDYKEGKKDCGCGEGLCNTVGTPLKCKFKSRFPNWIITDMRFPNELKAVKDRGGITIRVNRDRGLVGEADKGRFDVTKEGLVPSKNNPNHPSETALDNAEFDFVIDNNGTIEDLVEKVKEILIKENIL